MKSFRQLRLRLIAPGGDEQTIMILAEGNEGRWQDYKVRECVQKFEDKLKDRWPAFTLRVVKVADGQYNFIFEPKTVEELLSTARLASEAVQ